MSPDKKRKGIVPPGASLGDFIGSPVKSKAGESHKLLKLSPEQCYLHIQARTTIVEADILDMKNSFEIRGQLEPIIVGPKQGDGRYPILIGQTRWRAAQLIPGCKLSAVVDSAMFELPEEELLATQIVENDRRNGLSTSDLLAAFLRMKERGKSNVEIAKSVGWVTKSGSGDKARVSRVLSLARLPDQAKSLMEDGIVTDPNGLYYLNKLNELNPDIFRLQCKAAREEGGLTRARIKGVYYDCKRNTENSDKSGLEKEPVTANAQPLAPGDSSGAPPTASGEFMDVSSKGQGSGAEEESLALQREGRGGNLETASVKQSAKNAVGSLSVHVEVEGRGPARLCLSTPPEKDGWAFVVLESGERVHIPLESVGISRLSFE